MEQDPEILFKALIELDRYDVKILPQRWGNTPFGFIDNNPDWEFLNKHVCWDVPPGQVPEKPDIWCQVTVPNEFQPVGNFNIGVTAGMKLLYVMLNGLRE